MLVNPTDHPVLDVIRNRWSPYRFEPRVVEDEKVLQCLEAARWAASSFNDQPWFWIVARRQDESDFGRMVAASYEDDRALGQRLFVYGPEGITIGDAMDRFAAACYPKARVIHLKVWQARLLAKLIRNTELAEVAELIGYLDTAGEFGEPELANELYGAPAITLDDWFAMPRDEQGGFAH